MVLPTYFGVLSQGVATTLTNDLAAYYSLDVDASDSSGNSNDGTISGATLVTGKINDCRSFDGVNDEITIPNPITGNGQSFSINVWVNWNSTSPGRQCIVTNWSSSASARLWDLRRFDSTDRWDFVMYDGSGTVQIITKALSYIPTGSWTMITVVYDSSAQTWSLYKNGSYDTQLTGVVGSNTPDTTTYIGNFNTSVANRPFDGKIDELPFYNRALTSAEVDELYNGGAGNNFLN